MKNNRRNALVQRLGAAFLVSAVLLAFSGCSSRQEETLETALEQTESRTEAETRPSTAEDERETASSGAARSTEPSAGDAGGSSSDSLGPSAEESSGDTAASPGGAGVPEGTALTGEELQSMEEFLGSPGNRNCLTCYYEEPEEISVKEMLYALLQRGEPVSQEEKDALGWTETYDTAKFPASMINEFLQEKFGISLSQVRREVRLPYLAEQDAYYLDISDTNALSPECISGTRSDGIYRILYTSGPDEGEWEVTLREKDDGYQFVSNVSLSAQANRDYVEQVMADRASLQVAENENYSFFYRPRGKELVFAVAKEKKDTTGAWTYYFKEGECILFTYEHEDDWSAVLGAYSKSSGRYIRGTRSIDREYGIEILEEFGRTVPRKMFR